MPLSLRPFFGVNPTCLMILRRSCVGTLIANLIALSLRKGRPREASSGLFVLLTPSTDFSNMRRRRRDGLSKTDTEEGKPPVRSRNRAMIGAFRMVKLFSNAYDPAVVGRGSSVSILSLTRMGMPTSGPACPSYGARYRELELLARLPQLSPPLARVSLARRAIFRLRCNSLSPIPRSSQNCRRFNPLDLKSRTSSAICSRLRRFRRGLISMISFSLCIPNSSQISGSSASWG